MEQHVIFRHLGIFARNEIPDAANNGSVIGRLLCLACFALTANLLVAVAPEPLDPAVASQLALFARARTSELQGRPSALFRTLALPQLLAVRDRLVADPASPRRDELFGEVLLNWGRVEGPVAFAYAREQVVIPRHDAMSAVLYGWASQDPDGAWDTAMVHSNRGADRRYPIMAMLEVIGEQDLGHALRLYQDLLPDKACLQCAASHLLIAASRDGQFGTVLAAAQAMAPGPLRDALRGQYWSYLGGYLPEWGLRDLPGISDPAERRMALTEFCKSWGLAHFEDCLEFILHRVEAEYRDDLILGVVQDWSRDAGHEEAVRVLKSLPTDLNDRAVLGLASTLANVDARAVIEWVRPRPYSETRTTALDRAMWRWSTLEPESAHAYLLKVDDRETRGILLWSYLRAGVRNGTFSFTELAEIDEGYGLEWRQRLFSTLGADLADPANNNGGRYDLKAYIRLIDARADLPAESKRKIIAPYETKH